MPGFDHFGFLAPYYENCIRSSDYEKLLRLADLPVSGALLDAGGGTGRVAHFLNGKAHPMVVADLSPAMLAEARRKDGVLPVCSPAETLPFADETFARIIMVDALHHVYSQRQTARELWRVLQAGGVLVIEEPDIRQFRVKLIALVEKLVLMRSHILSAERMAELFDAKDAQVRVEKGDYQVYVVVRKREMIE